MPAEMLRTGGGSDFEVLKNGCGSSLRIKIPPGRSVKAESDALVATAWTVAMRRVSATSATSPDTSARARAHG